PALSPPAPSRDNPRPSTNIHGPFTAARDIPCSGLALLLLAPRLLLLDHAVGAGVEQVLMPVGEPNGVRRRAAGSAHFNDLAVTVFASDRTPMDVDPVTDGRAHTARLRPR